MTGLTYSNTHYDEYHRTSDKNIFEDVVDNLMIDGLVIPQEIKDRIQDMPIHKKRLNILSFLDEDRHLFTKIKSYIEETKVSKMEHVIDVVEMLRIYVKVGTVEKKKYGEVMTPVELVEEMLDKLPMWVWSDPNLKWFDPANGTGVFPMVVIKRLMDGLKEWEPNEDRRYKHIIENMIYVCELQPKNMFLYLCLVDPYDNYTCNIYTGSFLDKSFDIHMEDVWDIDNFDIVIGNPPYNQNIDLKFLSKSHSISNQILFVHPSTWLLDEKLRHKGFIKIRELIKDDLKSVKLFNGNGVFGISLFVPCVITYVDKLYEGKIRVIDKINDKEIEYTSIFDINKYNTVEYSSLKSKINGDMLENIDNKKIFNISTKRNSTKGKIGKYSHLNTRNEFYVNISQIRGHVNISNGSHMLMDDFYTIVTRDNKTQREISNHMFWKFTTKGESDNFLGYLRTKFVRFCLSIYKNNSQLECSEMSMIPWLDFTQEWTDEKLRKKFNITDKEWEFIDSVIPDYY